MNFKNYKLSILIPAWNAEKYIVNCINSLLENDYENYEIIIIVGGNDNSYKIALNLQEAYFNKIKVLEQKSPNKNKALNLGLNEVTGDVIILIDIDFIHTNYFLKEINEIFQNRKYNVLNYKFFPYKNINSSLSEYYRLMCGKIIISSDDIINGEKLYGTIIIRREFFFNNIKMFNDSIATGTDRYLGIQINKLREKIHFSKELFFYTECFTDNLIKFIKQKIRWNRNTYFPLVKKELPKIFLLLGVGLFTLFYPFLAILIALFFLGVSYICLFLIPWFLYYIFIQIKYFFILKINSKKIYHQLQMNFNYKKAFKIMPLMFFIIGFIYFASYIYPKRSKWLK